MCCPALLLSVAAMLAKRVSATLTGRRRRFFLGTWNMKGFLSEERPIRTLREVLQRLRESYCGTIGYEARTCPDTASKDTLKMRVR